MALHVVIFHNLGYTTFTQCPAEQASILFNFLCFAVIFLNFFPDLVILLLDYKLCTIKTAFFNEQ